MFSDLLCNLNTGLTFTVDLSETSICEATVTGIFSLMRVLFHGAVISIIMCLLLKKRSPEIQTLGRQNLSNNITMFPKR